MDKTNSLKKFKVHKHQIDNAILGLELVLKSISQKLELFDSGLDESGDDLTQEVEEYLKTINRNWINCKKAMKNKEDQEKN